MFSSFLWPEESPAWVQSLKGAWLSWRKGRSVYAGRLGELVEGFGLVLALSLEEAVLEGLGGL